MCKASRRKDLQKKYVSVEAQKNPVTGNIQYLVGYGGYKRRKWEYLDAAIMHASSDESYVIYDIDEGEERVTFAEAVAWRIYRAMPDLFSFNEAYHVLMDEIDAIGNHGEVLDEVKRHFDELVQGAVYDGCQIELSDIAKSYRSSSLRICYRVDDRRREVLSNFEYPVWKTSYKWDIHDLAMMEVIANAYDWLSPYLANRRKSARIQIVKLSKKCIDAYKNNDYAKGSDFEERIKALEGYIEQANIVKKFLYRFMDKNKF